ncbi:hypothetical protein ACFVWY_28225 [Streptomyces sp. NPDC058195]|uniref:hypothetical protein n=1 Tax=Streptomyces sp. NPDC058195 TaxID=3346375 RepID=UPI0036EE0E21
MTSVPSATVTPSPDRCPVCHELAEGAARWWTLRSRHRTSEGEVEYCTGGCGCLVVLVNGDMLKALPALRR